MLYAEYKGDEVFASEFPNELAALNTCADGYEHYPRCPECDSRVTHRDESTDGKAAHFAHCNFTGGGGADGSHCSGPSVGESQEHKAMKSIATSAIEFALEDIGIDESYLEVELPAPHTDKKDRRVADCLIEFEGRDEQLGEGLIIETQYKNKSKDKQSTTLDYLLLDDDYSVLWLWEGDFQTDDDLPQNWNCKIVHEETVRDRVQRQIWPPANPESIWEIMGPPSLHYPLQCDSHVNGLDSTARVTFSDPDAQRHIDTVAMTGESSVPATLPPEWHIEQWRAEDWDVRFDPAPDYTDIWCYSKVPASVIKDWVVEKPEEYWRSTAWEDRFRGDSKKLLPDVDNRVDATFYIHRWLSSDNRVYNYNNGKHIPLSGVGDLVRPTQQVWLIPDTLFKDMASELVDSGVQPEPERPGTVFDDVQCRMCGTFWHVDADLDACPTCGTDVDLEWNLKTGRIRDRATKQTEN